MKRFTETLKWQDPWFRRLTAPAKMLWWYATEHCDNIGIFEADLGLISSDCGLKVNESHLTELGDRIQSIGGSKYFIPKFISFQYNKLSAACRPHEKVIEAVNAHGLVLTSSGYKYPVDRVSDTLSDNLLDRAKDSTGKGNGQEQEGGKKTSYLPITETLWPMFPKIAQERSSKKQLDKELKAAEPRPDDPTLIESLTQWCNSEEWNKDGGKFIPGAHRWASGSKWDIEPTPQQQQQHSKCW